MFYLLSNERHGFITFDFCSIKTRSGAETVALEAACLCGTRPRRCAAAGRGLTVLCGGYTRSLLPTPSWLQPHTAALQGTPPLYYRKPLYNPQGRESCYATCPWYVVEQEAPKDVMADVNSFIISGNTNIKLAISLLLLLHSVYRLQITTSLDTF